MNDDENDNYTTIRISKQSRHLLGECGTANEALEDILVKVCEFWLDSHKI